MFVRWKAKALRRGGGGTSYHAQLVKTTREGAHTLQHVVAYLGAYQESDLCDSARRATFWRGVDQRLKALGLPAEEEARVRDALVRRVPLPLPQPVGQQPGDAGDADSNADVPAAEAAGVR